MIGWTIFNCLCLGVCLIFMFSYDKEYLSNLLKYDATIIIYIFLPSTLCELYHGDFPMMR